MTRPLTVAILLILIQPLFAQGQQPNVAKLKADAQKVVGVISADKAKTQTYCQIAKISEQVDQAARGKDRKKAEELVQKINELEKQLGPEYLALVDALFNNNDIDLNSEDFEEIVSMFDRFDESCRH
jgi:aspartokinase